MGRVSDLANTGRWHHPPYLLTLKMVATLFPKQENITSQLNHKVDIMYVGCKNMTGNNGSVHIYFLLHLDKPTFTE
jgi:hypothetical protein